MKIIEKPWGQPMAMNYGGIIIRQLDIEKKGRQYFASGAYDYYMELVEDGAWMEITELQSYTVYVLYAPEESSILSADSQIMMVQGDVLQVELQTIRLNVVGASVRFLVSGVSKSHAMLPYFNVTHYEEIYKVKKPWGHELWLNGEHPAYSLKQVALMAGLRTSLQYHQMKQETNILFEGEAYIHYKSNQDVPNDAVLDTDIDRVQISPISSVDVVPKVIHRVESITDILLYETSTPYLDDVIRIADDSNRHHGRIKSEHGG
jgi:mannose-6-phosphate isomerase